MRPETSCPLFTRSSRNSTLSLPGDVWGCGEISMWTGEKKIFFHFSLSMTEIQIFLTLLLIAWRWRRKNGTQQQCFQMEWTLSHSAVDCHLINAIRSSLRIKISNHKNNYLSTRSWRSSELVDGRAMENVVKMRNISRERCKSRKIRMKLVILTRARAVFLPTKWNKTDSIRISQHLRFFLTRAKRFSYIFSHFFRPTSFTKKHGKHEATFIVSSDCCFGAANTFPMSKQKTVSIFFFQDFWSEFSFNLHASPCACWVCLAVHSQCLREKRH